jgi:hypothetical protein
MCGSGWANRGLGTKPDVVPKPSRIDPDLP